MLNDIKRLTILDYHEAYDKFERYCLEDKGLTLMGAFGEVGCPSISDLDVFVCFSDRNFSFSRSRALEFIKNDSVLSYVFAHDPLIVPESMLSYVPFLHTLYDLNLTHNPGGIEIQKPSSEYIEFYNFMWTTFIIVVASNVLLSSKDYTDRFKLLLLKNVHQSIDNFRKNKDMSGRSLIIRKDYLNSHIGTTDIDFEIHKSLDQIFSCLNDGSISSTPGAPSIKNNLYYLSSRVMIKFNKYNSLSLDFHRKKIVINAGIELFKVFETLYYGDSEAECFNKYFSARNEVLNICSNHGLSFPFIMPFLYPLNHKSARPRVMNWVLWRVPFRR